MANALITLNDPATIVAEFRKLLDAHNKVLLVVLGSTPQHLQLAQDAASWSEAFRYAVWVTFPEHLYKNTILQLPIEPKCKPLPLGCDGIYGVSIALDSTVCYRIDDTTFADINLAFQKAEKHGAGI